MCGREVFVFTCGLTDIRGLTLDRLGRNLPLFQHAPWTLVATSSMEVTPLACHTLDPVLACQNLSERGVHVGRGA